MRTARQSVFLLLPALAALLLPRATDASPVANSAQIESGTEVDAGGRVIRTRDGRRPNYPRGVVARPNIDGQRTSQVSTLPSVRTGPAGGAALAAPLNSAFASFASLGYCLGCTGLPLHRNGRRID